MQGAVNLEVDEILLHPKLSRRSPKDGYFISVETALIFCSLPVHFRISKVTRQEHP